MLKRIVLALTVLLMPAAAMAQESPGDTPKKHDHAAASEHVPFPQLLIQKRAELKLTDEQIAKLEAISVKMTEHHKMMGAHHTMMSERQAEMRADKADLKEKKAAVKEEKTAMKHGGEHHAAQHAAMKHGDQAEAEMHEEMLAIFTPEQLEKVRPLMKQHMDAMCAKEGAHCTMKMKVKAE